MKLLAAAVSLGCAKNLVDSEMMVSQLVKLGYTMTGDLSSAALILVNTCGFMESAVDEAIEAVLTAAEQKKSGACECLVVTGCMVQRYGNKLTDLLPEVDLFLGTSHYHFVSESIGQWREERKRRTFIATPRHLFDSTTERLLPRHSPAAYLKIAEGCGNRCSFCMIPRLRGAYRSRTPGDILEEASKLIKNGVKEINLVAQDTTAFGVDRGDPHGLIRLLEALDGMNGLEWVRLLYAYPEKVDDALLRTMAQSQKTVPYLDIPFQHSVPGILRAMGRSADGGKAEELIERIRFHLPGAALRSSLIVGFPGETESDFLALKKFVERVELDHLGVFAFSPEAGTKAARMASQIDPKTKERRRSALLALQRDISRRRLEKLMGQVVQVLVEGCHPETELLLVGRMATQAPEVDGTVIITSGTAEPGHLRSARISGTHEYDVEAELLSFPENGSSVLHHGEFCKEQVSKTL